MAKILLTGATGFVGSALLSILQIGENKVVAVVRAVKVDSPDNFVQVGEINDQTDFSSVLEGVDVVVHMAARAHIMKDESVDPLAEYRKVNVDGSVNLSKQAVAAGAKRFIYISSVKVNGESTSGKNAYLESALPQPEDAYGISKYEAEEALKELAKQTGLELVIIRPPLVYGAGVKANFLSLTKLSLKPIPLPFGSVHNKRSMVYLGNLVDFIVHCIDHPAAANQTFLISDNYDTSLAGLIATIRKAAGKPRWLIPVPVFLFRLAGNLTGKQAVVERLVGDLQIDSSKARTLLNWQPPFTFEEGITATVKHFQSQEKIA